jgi:hypothetical protein
MSGKTKKTGLAKRSLNRSLNRRTVLKGAAATVAAAAVGLPAPYVHAARSIKVGVYGGYFKDSFDEFIFPEFAAASGIEVESVAEPTGETWLVQIRNAAKAGVAPADISMMGGFARLRGAAEELWLPLDESQMPNATKYLDESFVYRYPETAVSMAWARCPGSSRCAATPMSTPRRPPPGPTCGIPSTRILWACWRLRPIPICSTSRPIPSSTRTC